MRVIIMGAAGFLGRAVLRILRGQHEVTAFDRSEQAWRHWSDVDGTWGAGPIVHGDIADFDDVHRALRGMDAVIHLAAMLPAPSADHQPIPTHYDDNDPQPFLTNLKGLWNVLECSRRLGVRRVVHLGSCGTRHPAGTFYDREVRRPDGEPYAICKRLQEEMCRQFFEAYGLPLIVLRVSYIVDAHSGIGRYKEPLEPSPAQVVREWVDRHDVAHACRLAMENTTVPFDILHVVEDPAAQTTCNSARAKQLLGLTYRGDVLRYVKR